MIFDMMIDVLRRRLTQILEKEGKSRYYLWKELRINQGLLSSFFNGKKNISLKNLERIVDELGYEIFLFKKSEIGREQHQKEILEEAKIVELHVGRIIEEFEANCDVYVRGITVGNGKVKLYYKRGELGTVPTKGRNEPESKQKSENPPKYRPWSWRRDPT